MKILNWNSNKNLLEDHIGLGLKLLFLFLIVYIFNTETDHLYIKLPMLCFALLLAILFVKKISQPLLWFVFLGILLFDLICNYFVRANHHFLLIYITLVIILFLKNDELELFKTNIKLLVVIVLLFSAIQKLLSPQFISGDFYYYMFNTGKFFKPFLQFNPEMRSVISNNYAQIQELGQTDPNSYKSITLKTIIPHLDVVSKVFAWLTIILELVVAIFVLWKPKKNSTHVIFIMLILGIFLTRMENGFLTLLAISGIWLTESIRFRAIYLTLAIMFLSLITVHIGFY